MGGEVRYFGDFCEISDNEREYMVMNFSSVTLDINDLWENSALSAKFLSGFWGKFFPTSGKEQKSRRNALEDSVRFIAAELLGNSVKFGYRGGCDIRVSLLMEENELRFYVKNLVDPDVLEGFQIFIQRLLSEDLNELYVSQMEKNALEGSTESRMGFLTILLDYDATLAWKFERHDDKVVVTTLARLPVVRQPAQGGH